VHPDLAGSVEVVIHQHDLGWGARRKDGCRDPVAVDPEGGATGGALRDGAGAVRPGGTFVYGLPDIGLQRCDAFAAREIAEVNGVGLVGGQAVVAALGVGGGDLLPRGAPVGRRVRDRPAVWMRAVELAEMVGHNRRLAAV